MVEFHKIRAEFEVWLEHVNGRCKAIYFGKPGTAVKDAPPTTGPGC